ncbi:MAG TPA: DUF169 domain-containing protein [Alicycliphilus sp.]|jgi:uncharacterized protein (DUF169 family)|uniref:DUF169 domain-containing protein n=1 Tax=Diaphorobacter limosus TaxID=3036128 RepID=A0ABZ0J7M0_9BURK|nr:DUF169 domain-containing protein [Diaphorobacter sp. Y-1]MBP7326679.1 DUF169 domain-containing protein [Alicycliphilus sp.]MCA0440752.1 DUF169 domain-containing protein [Pseudomonadota bacterium]MBP7327946.1 DUF169 domain-containing protein [Alicycliphilus sp.]WOO33669.1 DUF169 domain-containing protein [Diaphorobacter sp. Y-1]HPU20544.1 DUF169 domain-containing protein [Alicycliphilus sp.]
MSNAHELVTLAADLERMLKLRTPPIGMKLLESAETLRQIPKLRRPQAIHTMDQIVGQAARLGWTMGVQAADLVGEQCRAVVGLGGQDADWYSGQAMTGVWFATVEDSARHQAAMDVVPVGRYQALVVAPLQRWPDFGAGADEPDIALFYATPGAMIYFINGLQWSGYERFDWSVVGESSCADSWGRALKTGKPSLSIPCFAERRYGGVLDDEMLMALKPADIARSLAGMQALARNGLRYPFASYGIQQDARAGMGVSYPKKEA